MKQLSFDLPSYMYENTSSEFEKGAEAGFKVGITFAIQEMLKFFASDTLSNSMLSHVWLAFLSDPNATKIEIEKYRSFNQATYLTQYFTDNGEET